MNAYASLPLALAVLLTVLLTPPSVLAHSEGPAHSEDSKAAAQKPSDAGMYRWKDARGMVHYSQGLQSVPEEFRATAAPLGQATSPAAEPRKP
jgi:hypothetical protein